MEGGDAVALDPGDALDDRAWLDQFPLSTRGRHIVNRHGRRFRLAAVNWYGASDAYHVVGGLDVQRLDTICETISKLGFTAVRLPFSNEMVKSQPVDGSIDFERNPRLRGLSALQVLDEVVRCLGRHCIAVILNNHTTYGEWCFGPDHNGLWFHPGSSQYTEARWLEDWASLAARYVRCPHVVGYDLRNEVRFCPPGSAAGPGPVSRWLQLKWPMLGSGSSSRWRWVGACDWASAARAAADRLLAVNPEALVIVERIVWPQSGLEAYAACPGPFFPDLRGRLVLAVHHYSWSGPGRYLAFGGPAKLRHLTSALRGLGVFSSKNYGDMKRAKLFEQLRAEWGWLLEGDVCPVWVSEFGGSLDSQEDMRWLADFVAYLASVEADWAYWPLNVGEKPDNGGGEPYGMLADDWTPKLEGDQRLWLLGVAGGLRPR